jgi:HAMP domain-containing protein
MASNLTKQVREISSVTKAVAAGDLSKMVEVDVQGEMLELKVTVNTMVHQLSAFSSEVTRVALEVGTKGILGGEAVVPDVQGTWSDLTNSVNVSGAGGCNARARLTAAQTMARNLTNQVRAISSVAKAVATGDLSETVNVQVEGEMLELKDAVNTMVLQLSNFSLEVSRVALEVGTKGILGGQARVPGVQGTWADLTNNVNVCGVSLCRPAGIALSARADDGRQPHEPSPCNLGRGQVRRCRRPQPHGGRAGRGRDAGAEGGREHHGPPAVQLLARSVPRRARGRHKGYPGRPGERARRAGHVGAADDQRQRECFAAFAGGRADRRRHQTMAGNLTNQVRAISAVAKCVAAGDLSRTVDVQVEGEMLELKEAVNTMVSQLSAFSSEVTRVALEVGTKGILGGQANVPGVQGTWADLTNNVNVRGAAARRGCGKR